MQQYGLLFGFREPYQVLVDADVLLDAARFKMDFTGMLGRTLHGEIKPMITQCCMRHLYAADPKNETVIEHAKNFERRRCNHHTLDKPLSTIECMKSVVDPKDSKINKFRYVLATQDSKVRGYMRTIPGVPLIYLKRSVMIMEPMAGATEQVKTREDKLKLRSGLKGRKSLASEAASTPIIRISDQDDSDDAAAAKVLKKKRKRGPSEPNPLSVKKAKTADQPIQPAKRKRKRRLPSQPEAVELVEQADT